MSDNGMSFTIANGFQEARGLLEKIFTTGRSSTVFSQPVQSGDYTVITAAEVSTSGGAGFGGSDDGPQGGGGGGGGGGVSTGRPVAAVVIGPDGVRVEPIVDETKIALALFSAVVALFVATRSLKKRTANGE